MKYMYTGIPLCSNKKGSFRATWLGLNGLTFSRKKHNKDTRFIAQYQLHNLNRHKTLPAVYTDIHITSGEMWIWYHAVLILCAVPWADQCDNEFMPMLLQSSSQKRKDNFRSRNEQGGQYKYYPMNKVNPTLFYLI